jgi:hypothetical protein
MFEVTVYQKQLEPEKKAEKIFIRMVGTWNRIQNTYRDDVINITAVTPSSM